MTAHDAHVIVFVVGTQAVQLHELTIVSPDAPQRALICNSSPRPVVFGYLCRRPPSPPVSPFQLKAEIINLIFQISDAVCRFARTHAVANCKTAVAVVCNLRVIFSVDPGVAVALHVGVDSAENIVFGRPAFVKIHKRSSPPLPTSYR